jgi:hypothetical protein
LERLANGELSLTDHTTSVLVDPDDVDPYHGEPAVRDWCAAVGMDLADLRCTEFSA